MKRVVDKRLSKKLKEKRFKRGYCYSNSFTVFTENKNYDIQHFVIGYCKKRWSNIAFRHAWNLSKEGNIVDVSLPQHDLDDYEYYEAFKYTYDEFHKNNVMLKTTGAGLLGLNVEAEMKCIKDNNLYVIKEDLLNCIYPYI